MHDRHGNELKVGDMVIVLARVVETNPTEDYCNITLETLYGRRPDGNKERVCAINSRVVVRIDLPD